MILELIVVFFLLLLIIKPQCEGFQMASINPKDNCPYERSRFFKNIHTHQRPIETPLVDFGRCARYVIQPGINLLIIGDILTWLGWTISFNARIIQTPDEDKTILLQKLNLSPISRVSMGSPAIIYKHSTKELMLYTKNDFGVNELIIPEIDLTQWVTLTWVQWKNKTYFYLNGKLAKWGTLDNSIPIIYLGPVMVRSEAIEIADLQFCNKGQNEETVAFN